VLVDNGHQSLIGNNDVAQLINVLLQGFQLYYLGGWVEDQIEACKTSLFTNTNKSAFRFLDFDLVGFIDRVSDRSMNLWVDLFVCGDAN
jgi:hypothetical protein